MKKIILPSICALGACSPAPAKPTQPNIIIFLADDAGYADFNFANPNTKMITPNLDQMREQGIQLTDMHSSGSVSGPSRCGIMTGRYQHRFGCETNQAAEKGLPLDETILPQYLKQQGYATAAFGKWHLGSSEQHHPNSRGYDEFYGFLGGHRNYFYSEKDLKSTSKAIQHNGTNVPFEGYLTDVLGQKAIDFIDTNKSQPFFIYLAYNAVHTPLQATDEDLVRFESHPRQKVAAMTYALDRSIGQVIDKLEKENLLENTLLVFLSDNGGDTPKCNDPLKAKKGTEFEGGHRVQCLMRWDAALKAGNTFTGLSSAIDLLPTCIEAAGIKSKPNKPLDGVSLLPYLKGKKKGNPHEWLFWRIGRWHAVRFNDYKYIMAERVGEVMYDLGSDLIETKNLIETKPKVYEKMKAALSEWESHTIAPAVPGEGSWDKVKAYMYYDLFNNRTPRYNSPGEVKNLKDFELP